MQSTFRAALVAAGLYSALLCAAESTNKSPSSSGAADSLTSKAKDTSKPAALLPLTPRERAEQLLNRFSFGPRPGEIDQVLALGTDKWLEQQLNPEAIKDPAWVRRQNDFPTLAMSPEQALATYADRGILQQVANAKRPMPNDPILAAVYEVQVTKLRREAERRKPDAAGNLPPEPSDAEKAATKAAGTATALRIAGQLFTLPRKDRMAALIHMPVDDRIAFTQYLAGDPRNLLFNDFTPHEREAFNEMQSDIGASYRIGEELAQAKMLRAILTERQLQDVMTDFWFNHFNVYIAKDSDQWYTTAYERDAIRKNALGHFSDLLLATAQHPAMLVYLDNWLSIGPGSLANGVNPANPISKPGNRGLNENYGREVMELHTVGVNGGYTQADVTNLSAMLTGWTVNNPGQAGAFQYDAKRHEPGTKIWLGHTLGSGAPFLIQGASPKATLAALQTASPMDSGIAEISDPSKCHHDPKQRGGEGSACPPNCHPERTEGPASSSPCGNSPAQRALAIAQSPGNEGMREGLEALNLLAHKPQTAHFISWKLAQRFVADDPPPALVDRMAATFLASDGDIKAVLRTLIQSPEFNSRRYFRTKVKTPMEFLASAFRTTATEPTNPGALVNTMRSMGMELYRALPPTGYYITADHWMNSTALVDRLNFADQLTSNKFGGQRFDAAHAIGLALASSTVTLGPQICHPSQNRHSERSVGPVSTPVTNCHPERSGGPASPSGPDAALHILEYTLLGGETSRQTTTLVTTQVSQAAAQGTPAPDLLNLTAGLLLGSPEFQLH
ncbi:MAG: hypothetical protein NVSMB62_07320 [Acidobacteriaceae bacterium]